MNARYLIRLDDACPTMNRTKWGQIEQLLDEYGVRPLVAVVPNNKDPSLVVDEHDPLFWQKVRSWQDKGWETAMHGETHLMHKTYEGQILPYYSRSEFTGLNLSEQCEKLGNAQEIFSKEGVQVKTWVAPAHSFNHLTLKALKKSTSIEIISDGIAADIYHDNGFYWVPQQFIRLTPMPFGLWTVCLHPNKMDGRDIDKFRVSIISLRDCILNFDDLKLKKRRRSILDRSIGAYYWFKRGKLYPAFR